VTRALSLAGLALAAATLVSCGGPSGMLGVRWGDDSAGAARKLHVDCATWHQWTDRAPGFEECVDVNHPIDAFGRKAYAHLYRAGDRIEGLALKFLVCRDDPQLDKTIRDKFSLEDSKLPYYVVYWGDGVVHYERTDIIDDCVLTVAGSRFGKAFQSYQLYLGLANFSAHMRAR
jgi:hypothetical protein